MNTKVYSAAKAVSLKKGKTKKEVWEVLTKMFSVSDNANHSVITFIYGGYAFDEKIKSNRNPNDTSVGDVFKAVTYHGSKIHVTVSKWNPYESFAYEEQFWNRKKNKLSIGDLTNINLIDHSEGTIVEIIRRERGLKIGLLDFILGTKRKSASFAAGRLAHIIGGNFPTLRDKESIQVGEFTVERDDSLR